MSTRWFGERVPRMEDERLLRGRGRFTDDLHEGALEACFVRSPYAHARITSIDVEAARAAPGVRAVYTASELPFGLHHALHVLVSFQPCPGRNMTIRRAPLLVKPFVTLGNQLRIIARHGFSCRSLLI